MYLDLLFFINFAVNTLLLTAAAHLTDSPALPRRLLAGAAAGALASAVLWFFADTPGMPLLRGAAALLTVRTAFGPQSLRPALLRTGVLWAVTCALAGVLLSLRLRLTLAAMLLGASGLALVCMAAARLRHTGAGRDACRVELILGDRHTALRAMRDTGHTLIDPVTNRAVLIADPRSLRPLFSREVSAVIGQTGTADAPALLSALAEAGVRGFTLIPYRTVGLPSGLLAAFAPSEVRLNGKAADMLVALCPTALPEDCDALVGAV